MSNSTEFHPDRYAWLFAGRRSAARRAPRAIRVLLIDDNELFVEALALTLAGAPRVEIVGSALDGRRALELVPELRPDVVVMDLEMPEMDGIETTRRLRALEPSARVVVLSANAEPWSVERAHEVGAVAYVTKDRPTDELVDAIEKATELARPFGTRFLLADPDVWSLEALPWSA